MTNQHRWSVWRHALLFLTTLMLACAAWAQIPIPPSSQFDITGFLQEATVTDPANPLSGGTLKVNGHVITVPANTIVIYPANALTWQELFAKAPAPWGIPGTTTPGGGVAFNGALSGPTTGMAAADCAVAPTATGCTAPPLTTYEVHVVGNRVGDTYIAGLIDIAQQGLNSGAGFINFIDYTLGEIRVGGVLNDPTTGARVRLNDPVGRYGLATTSPDVRFTVDPDNPTIMAGTGYPMCLPRTTPTGPTDVTSDPQCPQLNRPLDVTGFAATVNTANLTFSCPTCIPAVVPSPAGTFPDSTKQAPMEVGDYITFAGTLVKDTPAGGFLPGDGPTVGPMPPATATLSSADQTYISAHTITSNVAIYTFAGSNPAYIMTDVTLIGTGGLTVLGAGEAVIRTRFEGMTTDISRSVHLYGIDLNPSTGATSDRDWGTIGVDQGAPLGAVKGRWRFRPPCLPFGSVPTKPDKECVMNAQGTFLPPTREMRAVIEGLQGQNPANPTAVTAANGIFWGQYHAPITEYIFPENVPGTPIVENNFNTIAFLACGGYTSSGIGFDPATGLSPGPTAPVLAGVLNPWPSNLAPPALGSGICGGFTAPPSAVTLTANPNSVVSGSGAIVTLTAAASGTAPITFTFAQAATDVPQVVLTPVGTNQATFVAPTVAANTTLHFTATATNSAGTATSPATSVAVVVDQPIVNHIAPLTGTSGVPVTVPITGIDPNGLPLTFTVTQSSGPAVGPITVVSTGPTSATATFTLTLPAGAAPAVVGLNVTASNGILTSATEFTTVTISNPADTLAVVSGEYRIGKQRLIVTATDSNPAALVFLNPYICQTPVDAQRCKAIVGGLAAYDPNPGAGGAGDQLTVVNGVLTIDIVGAPRPACNNATGVFATPCADHPLTVRDSVGSVSPAAALTKIRQ